MNSNYVHNPWNTACQIEYQYASVSRRRQPKCSSSKKYYMFADYNQKRKRVRKKQECEHDNHDWVYITDHEPEDDEQICPHRHMYKCLHEHNIMEYDHNHRRGPKHKRSIDTTYKVHPYEYIQEHHHGCIHDTELMPGNNRSALRKEIQHQYIYSTDNADFAHVEDTSRIEYMYPIATKKETRIGNPKLYKFIDEPDTGYRNDHKCIHNTVHFNKHEHNRNEYQCVHTKGHSDGHSHCNHAFESKCIEKQPDDCNNNMELSEHKNRRVQIQYECNNGLTPTSALIQDLDETEKPELLCHNTKSINNGENSDLVYYNTESIQDKQMLESTYHGTESFHKPKQSKLDLKIEYEHKVEETISENANTYLGNDQEYHKVEETISENANTYLGSDQEYKSSHILKKEVESENKQKDVQKNMLIKEIVPTKFATIQVQHTEKESVIIMPNLGSEHISNIPRKEEQCKMNWENYHRLADIHDFIDKLEVEFPSLCTAGIIGTSREGRDIKVLKISNSDAKNESVWMDAGIHAREWIGPAVNTYVANFIARNFNSLPKFVTNKDWYFLPVVNPDGYEYSHEHDRMWRKNRAWYSGQCVGVDLNRNFSFNWGGKGSSHIPTHCFYRGPQPFSEPESSAVKEFMTKSGIKFKVYVTLHSYGQVIIFPFASKDELCPDYIRLLQGACAMSKAIHDTNGTTYKVGLSKDMMYRASGTSTDWCYGALGIPYCYLIELRSKKHKFKLPKEEILETGQEILNGLMALVNFVDRYDKIDCERTDKSN